jgi:hypothetical protein
MQPIRPEDIPDAKLEIIPDFVIKAFNDLIALNYCRGSSKVYQKDVVATIKKTITTEFQYTWLNVEDIYRKHWKVTYDKPAYNEEYDAYFLFEKK